MTTSWGQYTEGLFAKHQIVVGGLFLNGHAIEVGTRYSGVLTENKQPFMSGLPGCSTGAGYTVSYDAQDEARSFFGVGDFLLVMSPTGRTLRSWPRRTRSLRAGPS